MDGVRLACFDLDNTLIDRQAAFVSWASAFAEERGLGEAAIALLVELDGDGFARREDVFGPARRRLALPQSVEELVAAYREDYPAHVAPAPESAAALDALRQAGWKVALVTNGPPSQREKLRRAGLEASFDAVCISEELGTAKPDRSIFAEAARRCGTTLEQARQPSWMAGDSPEADIAGGAAAGLRTVWLHRGRRWSLAGHRPDACAASVGESVRHILASG